MYLLLSQTAGWRHAPPGGVHRQPGSVQKQAVGQAQPVSDPEPEGVMPFVLHLEQNRSSLPPGARGALIAILALAFVATLGPALRGSFLVPVAVLAGMAALLLALEVHRRLPTPFERLEIDSRMVRIWSRRGLQLELPSYWTRIETFRRTPADLRLALLCRGRSFELGHCIGADERGAVAHLVAAALAHVQGAAR